MTPANAHAIGGHVSALVEMFALGDPDAAPMACALDASDRRELLRQIHATRGLAAARAAEREIDAFFRECAI